MKKIPCISCSKKVESTNPEAVATLCESCLTDENIKRIGKDFSCEDLREVLRKSEEINEFGEII